jgi:hypothetical protein
MRSDLAQIRSRRDHLETAQRGGILSAPDELS